MTKPTTATPQQQTQQQQQHTPKHQMRDNEGFAKLRGHNVEYFIQKLSVSLGRTMPLSKEKLEKKIQQLQQQQQQQSSSSSSNNNNNNSSNNNSNNSLLSSSSSTNKELLIFNTQQKTFINDEKSQQLRLLLQEQEVDIPLGPYKNISRLHAKISYNFAGKFFELAVLSKNGVKIDGKYYGKDGGHAIRLRNGSEVQIGDSYFIFQLPTAHNSSSTSSSAISPNTTVGNNTHHHHTTNQQATMMTAASTTGKILQNQQQIQLLKKNQIYAKPVKTNPSVSMDKPNVSYATMIAQALASTTNRTLSLQQIYQWISDTYPYYTQAEVGWKSSVRHNLSHSKFFHKVPQEETESNQRGIYTLNPEFEQDLLQGLTGRKLKSRIKEKEGGGGGSGGASSGSSDGSSVTAVNGSGGGNTPPFSPTSSTTTALATTPVTTTDGAKLGKKSSASGSGSTGNGGNGGSGGGGGATKRKQTTTISGVKKEGGDDNSSVGSLGLSAKKQKMMITNLSSPLSATTGIAAAASVSSPIGVTPGATTPTTTMTTTTSSPVGMMTTTTTTPTTTGTTTGTTTMQGMAFANMFTFPLGTIPGMQHNAMEMPSSSSLSSSTSSLPFSPQFPLTLPPPPPQQQQQHQVMQLQQQLSPVMPTQVQPNGANLSQQQAPQQQHMHHHHQLQQQ